jgi:hypothetical protein
MNDHTNRSERAGRFAASFERAANALERSAVLADEHAEREMLSGRADLAAIEHEHAVRARRAARAGRAIAQRWLT